RARSEARGQEVHATEAGEEGRRRRRERWRRGRRQRRRSWWRRQRRRQRRRSWWRWARWRWARRSRRRGRLIGMPTLRDVGTAAGIAGGVVATGLAYAHLETKLFRVRRVTVPLLPPGQRPVRVLHISDLHLTPSQRTKQAWVRSLAELEPDLVSNTGDNVGHEQALAPLLDVLGPLMDVPGAFVMGSNDYYAPSFKNPARYLLKDARVKSAEAEKIPLPADVLAKAFTDSGWVDLDNDRGLVEL